MNLNNFIGKSQLSAIKEACKGEEKEYFKTKLENLKILIETMPGTYETDGQGGDAIAYLHYFNSGSDWWITEKDAGAPDDETPGVQHQAFGLACLNGDKLNSEMGYISIEELIKYGVEIDLYWKPETINNIRG